MISMATVTTTKLHHGLAALPSEYDDYVRGHADATPYHRSAWLKAIDTSYQHPVSVAVHTTNGRLDGILPLCRVSRPLGPSTLISLPFCDLCGPLADSHEIKSALLDLACQEFHSETPSLAPNTLVIRERGEVVDIHADSTVASGQKVSLLCALPASADTMMAEFKPKLRSQIRKAEKNGLTATLSRSADSLAAFYDVYAANMRRLGSPVHSRRWFAAIAAAYGDDMILGLVWKGSTVVGAGMVLFSGTQAVIPWASTRAEYNPLAPNMLLYWHLLSHACDRGCVQFDFGRSTFGEGTYRFKRQWGAKPVALRWQTVTASGTWRDNSRQQVMSTTNRYLRPLLARAWQVLPLPLTNTLGPRLRRYITL